MKNIKWGRIVLFLWVVGIAAAPAIGIWSVNTLFPAAAIPYTLKTWFAGLLLVGLLRG